MENRAGALPSDGVLLTMAEAAQHLGVSRKRVAELRNTGALPCVWLSESRCRFRTDVVAAFGQTQARRPEPETREPAALARGHEIAWLRETAALYRQIADRWDAQADVLEHGG